MKNLILKKYIILIALSLISSRCFTQNNTSNLEKDIQAMVERIVLENKLPGMTASIYFHEDLQINVAGGLADKMLQTTMKPNSRMPAGSIGKLPVAIILHQLLEKKAVSIDEPVQTFLGAASWFNRLPNASNITLRQLLQHTSGLPEYYVQSEFLADFKSDYLKPRSPAQCIQYVLDKPAVHTPGKGWSYSDTNYLLLCLVIEKISGATYESLLRDFLASHHLHSSEPLRHKKLTDIACGYIGSNNLFGLPLQTTESNKLVFNPEFEWTGGGMLSTSADLAKLLKSIHENQVIASATYADYISPVSQTTGLPHYDGYGLGTFVYNRGGDIRYGHSGYFPGYIAHAEYSSAHQYAIAIQINSDDNSHLLEHYVHEFDRIIERHIDAIDEAIIRANFKNQEKCWNAHDIACYMTAYATNIPIQTVSRGGVTYGYDNIISDYRKNFPKETMGTLHFDMITPRRLHADLYFVTGRFNLQMPGREQPFRGWFSANMKKVKGKWYMITDHSS